MNNRDCEHGQLGRTCPLCELEEELAEKAKTIAALEREVEALHKDAKRYQWLKSKRMFRLFSADMSGRHTFATVGRPIGSGRDIDEAIDAEIGKPLAGEEADKPLEVTSQPASESRDWDTVPYALNWVRIVRKDLPAKYGCHCDLEEGMEPDDCVIDSGQINDCVYAQIGIKENSKFRKEDCEYWQPINIKALAGGEAG